MCALCGATLIRAKRILLPVRNLQFWIERNILLFLKDAPFDKRDAHPCRHRRKLCRLPKRTGQWCDY